MKSVKSLKIFRLAENTFVRYLTFDLSTLKKVYYGVKFTFQIVCPHCEQAKSLTKFFLNGPSQSIFLYFHRFNSWL